MTASMCERAGLELGWLMPCELPDEDGQPCRYHQGAADAIAAVRDFMGKADGRAGLALAQAKAIRERSLRLYGEGVVDGLTGAHEVMRKFLETGTSGFAVPERRSTR